MATNQKLQDAISSAERIVKNRQIIFELTGLTSMKLVSKWFNEFDELQATGMTLTRDQYVREQNNQLHLKIKEYENNHNHKTNNDKAATEKLHQGTD